MTKRYKRQKITSIKAGDAPTRERRIQNGGVTTEVIDRDANGKVLMRRYRANWECPLDAYRDYRAIGELEYRAGLRFREAYYKSVLSRKAVRDRLDRYPSTLEASYSDRVLKQAFRKLSPYNKGTIIDICGHDLPARDREKFDRLREGLSQLVALWHLAAAEITRR